MLRKIKQSKKHPFLIATILWYFLFWFWAFQTDILDLAGSRIVGWALAIFIVSANVALSVFIMKKSVSRINRVYKKLPKYYSVPIIIILFSAVDFFIAWLPAAIWLGPQGRIDSILPLSSPALLLINTPLVFASRLIGYFGLAGLFWSFVYLFIYKKQKLIGLIPVFVLCLLSLSGWLLYRTPNGSSFKTRIISETLVDRIPPINAKDEKLVIFPEYGLEQIDNKNLKDRITSSPETKTYFLGSEQVYSQAYVGHINRMVFGNTTEGINQHQDKYRLIPAGEDMPFILRTLLRATNQVDTLNYFSSAKGVIKSNQQLVPFVIDKDTRVAAAVCSSIISPSDYRQFTASGATVLTNSASLTTFKGSRLFAWKQKSLGRFMAVANSRYFLQSANSASAYAFDNNGKKLVQVYGKNSAEVNVINNTRKIVYSYIGEWMVYIGFTFTAVYLGFYLKNKYLKS